MQHVGTPTLRREVHINALDALLGGWQDGFDVQISVVPKSPRAKSALWRIGPAVDRQLVAPSTPKTTTTPTETDVIMQLLDSQQVVLSVAGQDKAGNPVAIPGELVWTVSDPAIAGLVDNGDGSQTLVTTGVLGSVLVNVSDDVDGDGTADFLGSLAVDVVAGPLNEILVSAGEPTDRA